MKEESGPGAGRDAGANVIQKKRSEGSLDLAYAKWGHRPMTRGRDVRALQERSMRQPKKRRSG